MAEAVEQLPIIETGPSVNSKPLVRRPRIFREDTGEDLPASGDAQTCEVAVKEPEPFMRLTFHPAKIAPDRETVLRLNCHRPNRASARRARGDAKLVKRRRFY